MKGSPGAPGDPGGLRTVTVVGASLAGLYAARALRAEGFDGRLVMVGAEDRMPYDRPPLSKDFLLGGTDADGLALTDGEEDLAELDAEWLLGVPAAGLDPGRRSVLLADGRELRTDGVVVATGAAARTLPGPPGPAGDGSGAAPLAGVHTLRSLADAEALRGELTSRQPRVVVIGAGFIGSEVASSCAALGLPVTVLEAAPLPLTAVLGEEMAAVCAGLHASAGVTLLTGARVAALRGAPGTGRVGAVELSDGRVLPADLVVAGVGVRPRTDWLAGSGIALDDGVVCDAGCVTALPRVVAAGDVARVAGVRTEHWTSAVQQAETAAHNLLAGHTARPHRAAPYFWSDQYGVRIQFAGHVSPGCAVRIVEGSPEERSFLAVYESGGAATGTLAVNRPRPFMRQRKALRAASGRTVI